MAESYGRYQLLKRLATGGMAQIYLAKQVGLEGFEKLMVVKRILPHLAENDDFITMFLDEARIAARLNHPNIVQIFDLGAQDDTFFIAMEYIHGEDIRKIQRRAEAAAKPIPLPLICRIIIDACAGLDYAHKRSDQGLALNIVHRDISPQNILVSFEGGVKVVDFGIAKAADQATVTKSGVLKGKYSYMSPEQAAGKPLDARSDIFALGVVLYELLTNTRLFKRTSDIATLNAVTECKVVAPSKVNAALPADLDAIVMKALTKSRDDRYPDARAMQQALEDWLLKNQLQSSASHLSEFLHDIYKDRLEQEAQEGRMKVLEAMDSGVRSIDEERLATPMSEARKTRSQRSSPSRATPSGEGKLDPRSETRAEGTPRTQSKSRVPSNVRAQEAADAAFDPKSNLEPIDLTVLPPPQSRQSVSQLPPIEEPRAPSMASIRTVKEGNSSWKWFALAGVVIVAALGLGAYALLQPKVGRVIVTVSPPGALVSVVDRSEMCRSPCSPAIPTAGTYTLSIMASGYQPMTKKIVVPESGTTSVDVAMTKQAVTPVPVDAGEAKVSLTFDAKPAGSLVFFNDEPLGPAPAVKLVSPGQEGTVRVEHDGYASLVAQVTATADAAQRFTYELSANVDAGSVKVVKKPVEAKVPVVTPDPPPRGKGKVRFVVTPWATVECPPYRFGDSPFADQEMTAGEYRCQFTNPDLGRQSRVVKVEANALVKVQVNFNDR